MPEATLKKAGAQRVWGRGWSSQASISTRSLSTTASEENEDSLSVRAHQWILGAREPRGEKESKHDFV